MAIEENLAATDPDSPLLDTSTSFDERFDELLEYCEGGQPWVVQLAPYEDHISSMLETLHAEGRGIPGGGTFWYEGVPLDDDDGDVIYVSPTVVSKAAAVIGGLTDDEIAALWQRASSSRSGWFDGLPRSDVEATMRELRTLAREAAARGQGMIRYLLM